MSVSPKMPKGFRREGDARPLSAIKSEDNMSESKMVASRMPGKLKSSKHSGYDS